MTNEELIKNFPECDRIKQTDMTDCVSRVFVEVNFYREVNDFNSSCRTERGSLQARKRSLFPQ